MAETLLTRRHDGQTIAAAVGSVVVVTLDESPTTGYGWALLAADQALVLVGSDFALPAQTGVGGGGQRTLRFEVRQPGSHRLQLVLVRPWEGEVGAVDRFSVTVQATPG